MAGLETLSANRALMRIGDMHFLDALRGVFRDRKCPFQALEAPRYNRLMNPDSHLVLYGNANLNPHLAAELMPASFQLRCLPGEAACIAPPPQGYGPVFEDRPNVAYVLVSKFRHRVANRKRVWLFESSHDRALQPAGAYFTEEESLRRLQNELQLDAIDEFPDEIQLVFAVQVTESGELLGENGEIELVHTFRPSPTHKKPPEKTGGLRVLEGGANNVKAG